MLGLATSKVLAPGSHHRLQPTSPADSLYQRNNRPAEHRCLDQYPALHLRPASKMHQEKSSRQMHSHFRKAHRRFHHHTRDKHRNTRMKVPSGMIEFSM